MESDQIAVLGAIVIATIAISTLAVLMPRVDIYIGYAFAMLFWSVTLVQLHALLKPDIAPADPIGDAPLFIMLLALSSIYSLYLLWVRQHGTPYCTTYQETA